MDKKCSTCKIVKPIDSFSLNKNRAGGHEYVCKECHAKRYKENPSRYSEQRKEYREKHKQEIFEQQRRWRESNHENLIEKKKQYYENNKASIWERVKRYVNTQRGKDSKLRSHKKYAKENPQKVKANQVVNKAVRSGKLPKIKTLTCSVCEVKQAQEYHHHNGYDELNWLDVIPVCSDCHKIIDKACKN